MSDQQHGQHWTEIERDRLKRRNLITAAVIALVVGSFITVSIVVSFLNASNP